MLESIAELFRAVMADTRKLVPLADEIELCRNYVKLSKPGSGMIWQLTGKSGHTTPGQKCHSYCCNR